MRIAIITFHRAYNCGAMLQAWALKTVLERMGHTVEFPCSKYNEVGHYPPRLPIIGRNRSGSFMRRLMSFAYRLALTLLGKKEGITAGVYYDAFRKRYLPERKCEASEFGKYFDAIVLGSDQVLNPNIDGWSSYFLCNDVPSGVRKIAYSASAGDKQPTEADQTILASALASFDFVSVRESFMNYPIKLDPSLLLEASDYDAVAKLSHHTKEYIYMYSCEASGFEVETARLIAQRLGLELIITPVIGTYGRAKAHDISNKISPSLMIGYIRGAKYVLAGSFHGTVFALLHGKPFLNILPDWRIAKRVSSILEIIGETDRIVNPSDSVDVMISRLTRPLCNECHTRLGIVRRQSLDWLENVIGEKRT